MEDIQKRFCLKVFRPKAMNIKMLKNGDIYFELDGKPKQANIYICWNEIKIEIVGEERLSDINKGGGLCKGYVDMVRKHKKEALQ